MMSNNEYKMKEQAYIDNQLSVDSAIAFEASLSAEKKAELERRRQFEAELADRLRDGTDCPDQVWAKLKSRLANPLLIKARPDRTWRWVVGAAAAVALIAFVTITISNLLDTTTADIWIPAIPGDYDKVRSSLTDNGFHLKLNAAPKIDGHAIELVGLRYETIQGQKVAHMVYNCCDREVDVFLIKQSKDGKSVTLPATGEAKKLYTVQKLIDSYRIFVRTHHSPDPVLDLFS